MPHASVADAVRTAGRDLTRGVLTAKSAEIIAAPDAVDALFKKISESHFVRATRPHFAGRSDPDRGPRFAASPIDLHRALDVVEFARVGAQATLKEHAELPGALRGVCEGFRGTSSSTGFEIFAAIVLVEIGAGGLLIQGLGMDAARANFGAQFDEQRHFGHVRSHGHERKVDSRPAITSSCADQR